MTARQFHRLLIDYAKRNGFKFCTTTRSWLRTPCDCCESPS